MVLGSWRRVAGGRIRCFSEWDLGGDLGFDKYLVFFYLLGFLRFRMRLGVRFVIVEVGNYFFRMKFWGRVWLTGFCIGENVMLF